MSAKLTLSRTQLFRLRIIDQVRSQGLTQEEASVQLNISVRHVRRLQRSVEAKGADGLIHRLTGKPSNHQGHPDLLTTALDIVSLSYPDYGPVLAQEALHEFHQINIPLQTLRRGMVEHGLWKVKRQRKVIIHPLRQRRRREGELVQIDGSVYPWFEDRGEECVLLVGIDDATGKLKRLLFVESESTWSYFSFALGYIMEHGKPVSWYMDSHSVFRVNNTRGGSSDTTEGNGQTQFGRAMEELSIGCIFAATPQAKGRVERVNQTLQDRLVKYLRHLGVSTMTEGNQVTDEFIKQFNLKFSVLAVDPHDGHHPLSLQDIKNLKRIFSLRYERILSHNLTFSFQSVLYQVVEEKYSYGLINTKVVIRQNKSGQIEVMRQGKTLNFHPIKSYLPTPRVVAKEVNQMVTNQMKAHIPSKNHPWRTFLLKV